MAIQIRRGTPEQWENSTEILANGQPAVSWSGSVTAKPVLKIGNGTQTFKELPAVNPDSQIILSGTTPPTNDTGSNGDIYYLYSE